MTSVTRPSRLARPSSLRGSIVGLLAAVVLAAPAAMLGGCGDSGPTIIDGPVVDTTTLAGTWKGTVNGVEYGYSTITYLLKADSTMTGEALNALYGTVSGSWTASTSRTTLTFRDRDGVTITSIAPFDKRRMLGTWSATSGKVGTFNVSKEPTQ